MIMDRWTFLNNIDMNHLKLMALFFVGCLFWFHPVIAQEQTGDTTEIYKMSYDKADSLLISSSKDNGEVKKKKSTVKSKDNGEVKGEQATIKRSERLKVETSRFEPLNDEAGAVDYRDLLSVNEGTLLGIGGYMMKDTYLSNEKYGGLGLHFMNERMRLTTMANNKISRQNIVDVDISSVLNGARNANYLSAFADYSLGYHYRFAPWPNLKIFTGGSIHGMFGMVYNTRNGNNPITVHTDIDLNLSFIAIYQIHTKKSPLAVRYQFETPMIGVLFSPYYAQSYYEIFSLGNTAEIFNFNSLHNKFAMRNYLMFDFPVLTTTFRIGYFGNYYSTNINLINRYIISHNVMIGFVKEFVAFGGRELKRRNLFNSAYY